MSLTGSLFPDTVIALTVLSFAALVVLWPALAGQRPSRILARAGLLVGVNLMVLLTAFTQLNAKYLFFADWSDLSGALGGTYATTSLQRGGSAAKAAGARVRAGSPGGRTMPVFGGGTPIPVIARGERDYTVTGRLSGITSTVVVDLPPGYSDRANAARRYPVLETFPGYPGLPTQWIGGMGLGGAIQRAEAARAMGAVVIVSPQTEIPAGADTECVNGSPGTPQLETWLTQDVPAWVSHTFRVQTARSSWATIGLSAGAWCAAMAAMLHPAQYSAAIIMGGYFAPDFSPQYVPYPERSAQASRYNLVALAQRSPPPVALWMETSHSDALSYGSSAALLRAARPPMAVDATVLQNAGHRMSIWKDLLPRSLQWLGSNVPGFRAGG